MIVGLAVGGFVTHISFDLETSGGYSTAKGVPVRAQLFEEGEDEFGQGTRVVP